MIYEASGLRFDARFGTSDIQAIKEVVEQKSYQRRFFQIEAGEHWLDLGANAGAFSCLAISKGATVEAYEPEPHNADQVEHNLALNGYTAIVHRKAIVADSETRDSLNFYLSNKPGAVWRHSLYKTKNKQSIVVPVARISSILDRVDAIKMDIEGAEIDILFSLRDFKNVRKLCFEYHFDINNSIPLFLEIMENLKQTFAHVRHRSFMPGVIEYHYNPPQTIVFCWR